MNSSRLTGIGAYLCIGALLFTAGAAANEDPGAIEVRVIDAERRRPLENVSITITARDERQETTTTDAGGRAVVGDLAPGLYALRAEGPGLAVALEPSIRVVTRSTTPIRLEMLPVDTAEIEEVIVVARALQADRYGPASATRLNREELRSAVGAGSDVMRALDGLPGLASTGDFANFSVRGRGPRDNLIFVDDFPLDKVVHFDQTLGEEEDIGGGGRFSIFAPNSIAGAEFSPGGWSAAYGGRSGSLLNLDVVGGSPTPSASLRVDIAGFELAYDGPSGLREDTTMYFTARSFDFGRVFEQIDELDIGQPELSDFILKTVTDVNARNSFEVLAIFAPETYTRDIENVINSPDFEDVSLIDSEQDLGLVGLTWRRLMGDAGEWVNKVYIRDSDKTSSEGEAFPDLVPDGTPTSEIPVNERILTVGEKETEIGWRSDYRGLNQFGPFSAGVRVVNIDADYSTVLREDWIRFVYERTDPRPPGQNFIVLTPEDLNSNFEDSNTNYTAYTEQVFDFGGWDLRTGLRFDRDGFADESLVSPRLAANWRLTPALRISATAGIFYQSPRFLTRAASPDNFGIENEEITHFSLGFERDFGSNWRLLFESYYQQLDNLVVLDGRTSGRVSNDGDGDNLGFDIVVTRFFDNGWSANATYSFNDATVNDNDGLGDYDPDFNRPHFFSIGGTWEINERWQIGARWKWGEGRPTDDFIVNDNVLGPGQPLRFSKELTRNNALRDEDYHSLNIRVDYRRSLGLVDLVAFVDVINVYGGPGVSSQEFNPRAGVNIVEEEEAFPIIGIIFERTW